MTTVSSCRSKGSSRASLAERVALRRLPEGAVAELLSALGKREPPGALVRVIFHETEGNPFFVGEVFQHLSFELFGPVEDDVDLRGSARL